MSNRGPPMMPGFDPSNLPPLPPGFDPSNLPPLPPGFDPSKLPPLPGFPPMPGGGRDDFDRRGPPPGNYHDDRRGPQHGGYDDRRGGYDDRRGPAPGVYDDRRGGYDDRRGPPPPSAGNPYDRPGYGPPPPTNFERPAPGGYGDDRRGPPGGYGGPAPFGGDDRRGPPPDRYGGGPGGYDRRGPPQGGYDDRRGPAPGGYHGGPAAGPPRRRNPPLRQPTNTVYVANADISDEEFYECFRRFGRILKISRMSDKGLAFIHYGHIEEADRAIREVLAEDRLPPQIQLNFGKQFQYTPEELEREWQPQQDRFRQQRQDDREGRDPGYSDRRDEDRRRPAGGQEPTNVLWVGEMPSSLSTETLRQTFQEFGNISSISRPEGKMAGMAFIHFDTVEQCTHALKIMRGIPIGGFQVKLNYGRSAAPKDNNGIPTNEVVTNVVWLGQLPQEVGIDDLNELFDQYPGYIDAKILHDTRIAFGHFDTPENAKTCREALQGYELYGQQIKVSYGKSNHSRTMADRYDQKELNTPGRFEFDPATGALVPVAASGALLPAELGGMDPNSFRPDWETRVRKAATATIASRLETLAATSYYSCGDQDRPLITSNVDELLRMIDTLMDEKDARTMYDFLQPQSAFGLAHIVAVIVKRLHANHKDDPHRKLHCFYIASRLLFYTAEPMLSVDAELKALWGAIDNYELLGHITMDGISNDGSDNMIKVIKAVDQKLLRGQPDASERLLKVIDKKKAEADFSKLLANLSKK